MTTKSITLTKRILIDEYTTNELFKKIWVASYNEIHSNSMFLRIPTWDITQKSGIINYEKVKADFNKYALQGARFHINNDFTVPGFSDSSNRLSIPIGNVEVEVQYWEYKDRPSYRCMLLVHSVPLQVHEIIGERLLVSDGNYSVITNKENEKIYHDTFFVKLNDDIQFGEYVIRE